MYKDRPAFFSTVTRDVYADEQKSACMHMMHYNLVLLTGVHN